MKKVWLFLFAIFNLWLLFQVLCNLLGNTLSRAITKGCSYKEMRQLGFRPNTRKTKGNFVWNCNKSFNLIINSLLQHSLAVQMNSFKSLLNKLIFGAIVFLGKWLTHLFLCHPPARLGYFKLCSLISLQTPWTQSLQHPNFSPFLFSLTQNITLHFVSLAKAELACSGCASLSSLATSDWLFRKFPPMRSRVSSHVRESWGSAGRFAGRPALGRCPGRSARAG